MSSSESHGGRYVVAILALLSLTAISFGLARADLGAFGTPVALGIAAAKASIVGMVFMHLGEASPTSRLIPAITVLFILLLGAGILADVAAR